ncbi:manganese/zinc/iron transport system substrate-binding protein [Tamaricihabitans halophyticus]|uniref:Manganese/zinc/iron transport system substrate-binding protein n=1 Tax=Tamaricihabitans halophyticus TaxID=1262583 RepID=A0A4R2QZK4_9PSEU|nr:zinc ABC transporter substrate-binding protein [Tamaricihabitans halophyticus]TCP55127.1 manganese/zinc/iron transport system substrate-binding protein [Tamaricihabitans halophyticus]
MRQPRATQPRAIQPRAIQRTRRRRLITGVILVAGMLLSGSITFAVWPHGESSARPGQLRVVSTTNFLTDTVREVGGDRVAVSGLMGPGVDPHLYNATASDVARLRGADLVVAVGLYLEGNLQPVLDDVAERRPVLLAGERIPTERLLEPADDAPAAEEFDPHVWFDVQLWRFVVNGVRDSLSAQDPANAAYYRQRAASYRAELDQLDTEIRARIATIPESRRVLVTSHDAFRYFGRAYDMDVVGIQGISTSDEATTADVERVANLVARRQVPAVFVESSVSEQTLQAVLAAARSRDHPLRLGGELYSDAAGAAGTPEGSYPGMLRANVDRLVAGLS